MRARRGTWIAAGLAAALLVVPGLGADERGFGPVKIGSAADDFETACAAWTEACDARIDGRLAAALLFLSEIKAPEVYPLARLAADVDSVTVRVAAAEALGSIAANAEDTPILAELLDDPVPAVRAAALRTLRSSGDERGRLFAARADRFGTPAESEVDVEAAQEWPALAAMGVAMPADALFLHFGSDATAGRYAWVTNEPAATVLGRYRGKGQGPFTLEEYQQYLEQEDAENSELADSMATEEGELPSPDQMAKAMEMAMQAMAAMNEAAGKSPEEQAAAASRAMGFKPRRDFGHADAYAEEELFGGVRLQIVPLDKTTDAVVAVYTDRVVGMTGVAVHRPPLAGD